MKTKFLNFGLFVILVLMGMSLAQTKPLWVDEVYSQTSIEKLSYPQIFLGQMPEGNSSPLFYTIQKVITNLAGYHLPAADYQTQIWDKKTMWILRLGPVVSLALAMVFMFYFFSRRYGFWLGLYGLLTVLFSYNVWLYWAEARPYALWFSLTIAQSLIFLKILEQKPTDKKIWRWLIAVHVLLALTVIFSLAQIVIVSFLLWAFKERDWKKHLGLMLIPSALCVPYYFTASKAKFFFPKSFLQLILPCFPKEWFGLLGVYVFLLIICAFLKKQRKLSNQNDPMQLLTVGYLAFCSLIFLATAIVLATFKANAITQEQGGFEISHRYFIYLTPIGSVLMTLIAAHLITASRKYPWLSFNIKMALWGFLIITFLKNSIWAIWFF
jgi:hypothetical protein